MTGKHEGKNHITGLENVGMENDGLELEAGDST